MSHVGALPRLAIDKEKALWKGRRDEPFECPGAGIPGRGDGSVGAATVGIGIWCLLDPTSFARVVGFGEHQHFLHDVGAFQLGLGVTLLLALIWADALATALAGFIVANTVHTVNHVMDLDLGGSVAQAWLLGGYRWR